MQKDLEELRVKLKGASPAETLLSVLRLITKWPGDPDLRLQWRMLIVGAGIPRVALAMGELVKSIQCVTPRENEATELHNMGFPVLSEEFLGLIPGDDLPVDYDSVLVLCSKEQAAYRQYVQHGYQFLRGRGLLITLVPIDDLLVNYGEDVSELFTFYEDQAHKAVSMLCSFDAGMLSVTFKPEDSGDEE